MNSDIKRFKEKCNIDDEDEVLEMTAASIIMKKNMPVCVTCNQTFAMENYFKIHIQEKCVVL